MSAINTHPSRMSIEDLNSLTSKTAEASRAARAATAGLKNNTAFKAPKSEKVAAPKWAGRLVDESDPNSPINKMQRLRNQMAAISSRASTPSPVLATVFPSSAIDQEQREKIDRVAKAIDDISTSLNDCIQLYKPVDKDLMVKPVTGDKSNVDLVEGLRKTVDEHEMLFLFVTELYAATKELVPVASSLVL